VELPHLDEYIAAIHMSECPVEVDPKSMSGSPAGNVKIGSFFAFTDIRTDRSEMLS
jgi:hypothetical protein